MLESLFDKVAGLKDYIFVKKETPAQVFSCEYYEIFKNRFLYSIPPVHHTFPKFHVVIEFFGRLRVQHLRFSNFLRHCFVFLHNAVRMSISCLFRICFQTKIFIKCNFRTHYNVGSNTVLIESLKFKNNPRITVASPSNLL